MTTGDAPCARTGHALALLGKSVVCVGGTSAERGFLNDMHVLDTDTWTWSTPIEESTLADSGFTPRDKLTAVCHGNSVLVFGGFGPQQDGDDAGADAEDGDEEEGEEEEEEEQDGTSFSWFDQVFIASRGDKGCWLWRHQPATGDAPSPRAAHGAACLGSCMYVFGGRDASGRVNDSYSLDCSRWVWSKHEAQVAPAPRSFHAFVPLPPPLLCCVTFGGLAADGKSLDGLEVMDAHQQPLQWLSAQQRSGAWPAARSSAAAALLSDRLIVLGGVGADDKCCPDVVLHLAPLIAALRQKEQAV